MDSIVKQTLREVTPLDAGDVIGVAARRVLDAAEGNGFDAQLDLEARTQRELGRAHDYREGVAAFQQKRKARFEGAPE